MSDTHRNTSITLTVRFAPYIEAQHKDFLDITHAKTLVAVVNSPYGSYETADVGDAFFYTGYLISNYPALYDMFGKYMSGFDVDTLYRDDFENLFSRSEINASVTAEMELINEDIIDKVLNKFITTMRDINAVVTSSFIIGKAMVEDIRFKRLAEISSKAKFELLFDPQKISNAFLDWSKSIATIYAQIMKLYYSAIMQIEEGNYRFKAMDVLWPFVAMDFERAALAALVGKAVYKKMEKRQRSAVSKGLVIAQYAVIGLTIGASIGSWVGMILGVVIGALVGLAIVLLE